MKQLLLLLTVTLTAAAWGRDINGGAWEIDEDLSSAECTQQLILEPRFLEPYAINDAMIYVVHHPTKVGNIYGIGKTHAIQNHRITNQDLIERYASTFSFAVDSYYDAKGRK